MPQQWDHCKEGSLTGVESASRSVCSGRGARRAHSKDKDATTRHAGEADGQTLAETAGSPGRGAGAGHVGLANVLVFVGMNPEMRTVAEIRSRSVQLPTHLFRVMMLQSVGTCGPF